MSRNKRPSGFQEAAAGFMPNPVQQQVAGEEQLYRRILSELAMTRFKWKGLPDTVDERYLEYVLFRQALAVFYEDRNTGRFLAVRASGKGRMNMYQNPTQFLLTDPGIAQTLQGNECVPIWANYMRTPDHDILYMFARKLAAISKTIDINLISMRQSQIVFVDENERLTYMNIMRQHQEGQPIIFGTPQINMENIKVFNLGIDKDQVVNLMDAKSRLWNEAMTLLGINNSNQNKKERLVSAEVGANDDQVEASRGVALKPRLEAAEQINRKYGLNVTVEWDESVGERAEMFVSSGQGGAA